MDSGKSWPFGCPPRFIAMARQFYDDMQARVQNDEQFSEPFEVTNGVEQGCIMAPTLFSMMFSVMPMNAFQECQLIDKNAMDQVSQSCDNYDLTIKTK